MNILNCNSNWLLKQFTVISVEFPLTEVFKSRLKIFFKETNQCNLNEEHLLILKRKLALVSFLAKVLQNIR